MAMDEIMKRPWTLALPAALCAVACAKGPTGPTTAGPAGQVLRADGEPFVCDERRAEYLVTGSMVAPVAGVRLVCDGDRPMVEEYTAGDDGEEHSKRARIDPDVWESVWSDVENLGWRRLSDCPGAGDRPKAAKGKKGKPALGSTEPFYVIEVRDATQQVSVACRGAQPAFPFGEIRDALDRGAIEARGEGR